jgi:phage-related tail fiber protein
MTSVSTDRRFGVNSSAAVKVPCRVATTANVTLSGHQTIDGQLVVDDDRVLVKNQTDQKQNGIYVVDSGTWTRAPDWDGPYDAKNGSLVYVTDGSTYADNLFTCTTSDPRPAQVPGGAKCFG